MPNEEEPAEYSDYLEEGILYDFTDKSGAKISAIVMDTRISDPDEFGLVTEVTIIKVRRDEPDNTNL